MVQSIENRAVVTGRVVRLRTEGDVAHIDVAVDGTESVEGFPNLLAPSAGTELTISIKGQAPELVAGDRFRMRARRSGPGVVWGDSATFVRVP